jgi:cellulose synthase operon protein C
MTTPKPPVPSHEEASPEEAPSRGDLGLSERPMVTSRSIPVLDIAEELGDFEFDPDDVLASLVPYDEAPKSAEPEVSPPEFGEEKAASRYVTDLNMTDAFRAIASRIGKELASTSDPAQGAELALAVSEIHALSGTFDDAVAFAQRAVDRQPASRLARMQVRQLSFETGDYQAIPSQIADELAILKDVESKAQLTLWHHEFLRLALNDANGALSVLSATRADFALDGQVSLLQFLGDMAKDGPFAIETLQTRVLPYIDPSAVATLLRIRGDRPDRQVEFQHPAAAFLEAGAALIEGNLQRATHWLSPLRAVPSCAPAIRWLCSCLAAQTPGSRHDSIEQLLELERIEKSPDVRRALLERAVEAEDVGLLLRLIEVPGAQGARSLSAAEELLLSLFCSRQSPKIRELFEDVANDNTLVSLAISAADLIESNSSDFSGTDRRARSLLTTARRISSASPTSRGTLPVWHELPDDTDDFVSLDFALNLEQAYDTGDWAAIGHLILDAEDGAGPWLAGDRETLAALYLQAGQDLSSAKRAWEKANEAAPSREAGLRALLEFLPESEKSRYLETYADSLSLDDDRVPWLLLEAALDSASTRPEASQQYLEHAHAISSDLLLTMTMGEDLARMAGDDSATIEWLSKRADLAEDPSEVALLAAEEALLHRSGDALTAETCATRALSAFPADPSLHGLRDYVAPGSGLAELQSTSGEMPPNDALLDVAARAAWMGDWRSANEAVILLSESDTSEIAKIWAESAAGAGQRNSKLFDKLFSMARVETEPEIQRELYERILRQDPNFGREGASDLWLNAIVERAPDNLLALRGLERSNARRNRWEELIAISEKLTQTLDRSEAHGYAWLASTLNIYVGNWANGETVTNWVARQEPIPLWALRRQYAYAMVKADLASVYSIQVHLAERAHYAADVTSLKMRSAEVAKQLGEMDKAFADLRSALDITPDHPVALSMLATWQLEQGENAAAAEVLEQIAQACSVQAHREGALSKASELWQNVGDEARSEYALEQLLNINPSNPVAVSKLTQIYRASGAHDRLAALLERQIDNTIDPAERAKLQIERARCLLALDLTIAAEKALEPALAAFPENIDVLLMKADIALAVDDRKEAEFTYTRLLRLVTDPVQQAALYRKLGKLHEGSEGQADLADANYRRLLEICPNDNFALSALVRLSLARSDVPEAIRLQSQLVEHPELPDQQRNYQLELARIHEVDGNDRRRAEELLEKSRRKWPNDSRVLRAFAEFYQRTSDSSALQVLLDRSVTEARRALHTGRFDVAFFEILSTVAGLRGQDQSAKVADSIALALRGSSDSVPFTGAGLDAVSPKHDEILAPELLNLPLRAMLMRTGWALDSAQPVELGGLKVSSLGDTNAALFDRIASLAEKFELPGLTVWLSTKIGTACIPAQCRPPTLVVGQKLLDPAYDLVRDFLLVRALKALQTNTACLARVPAVEIWPLLSAYLGVFLPNWQPPAVDAKRFEEAKQRIEATLASAFTHDMSALAQDVVLALGNRVTQIGEAANEWGSRTALLALGNPEDALDALALTASAPALPKDNPADRVKWINRHAEARNLMIFAVSDGFLQLRSQLLHG